MKAAIVLLKHGSLSETEEYIVTFYPFLNDEQVNYLKEFKPIWDKWKSIEIHKEEIVLKS